MTSWERCKMNFGDYILLTILSMIYWIPMLYCLYHAIAYRKVDINLDMLPDGKMAMLCFSFVPIFNVIQAVEVSAELEWRKNSAKEYANRVLKCIDCKIYSRTHSCKKVGDYSFACPHCGGSMSEQGDVKTTQNIESSPRIGTRKSVIWSAVGDEERFNREQTEKIKALNAKKFSKGD